MSDLLATNESKLNAELSPEDLTDIARTWVPRVGNSAGSGQPSDRRWYCRLEHNETYEVWLLGWNQTQSTDFHNHGGSSGAVVVVSGTLVESRPGLIDGNISNRMVSKGDQFSFGPEVVHNVENADLGPSLSIHVYSPPLSSMTYFDVSEDGLVARETVAVDSPEPGADEIKLP
jgi:hypothetical protein